jgi:nickel/cobalt transporter (NicO) family protein
MGNFSVNRWTRLSPRAGGIDVTHVIDLAEIPTQRALSEASLTSAPRGESLAKLRDALAARFLPGLVLTIEGARAALKIVRSDLEFAPGVADLPTARLTLDLEASVPVEGVAAVAFSDTNFEGRTGWKEVVAAAGKGATLLAADVPASDRTRRLTEYPSDPAEPPSEVTSAALRVRFGSGRVR